MADYGPLYQAAGNQYVIDPLLLQALASKESEEKPGAVGPVIQSGPAKGQQARGIMQFLPGTAAEQGVDVNDATSSVYGASRYMNKLMDQYGQNLPQALAVYGGTTPDSQYVTDVMGRYRALKAAWNATGPQTAPPAVDTDPASPTVGMPTGTNVKPSTRAPDVFTMAKGNPGQPDISVPITNNAVTVTAPPSFAPPEEGGPKAEAKPAAAKPDSDPLSRAQPHVDEAGAPLPSTATPAPRAKDPLSQAQPHINEDGTPIQTAPVPPSPNQQYMYSATSPGALAVGATPTGTNFAEGKVPGPVFQAAINVATDPDQKARIAADQLGIPLDRIIIGPGGRMAAVDDKGQPYFIQPAPVLSSDAGITKPQEETGSGVVGGPMSGSVVAMSGTPGASVRVTEPGQWQPTSPFASSPYGRLFREPQGISPSNIAGTVSAAVPGTIANALTYAPGVVGNPGTGSLLVGGASMLTDAGRQWLANRMDPNAAARPDPWAAVDATKAVTNALLNIGGRFVLGARDQPLGPPQRLGSQPGATSTQFPSRGWFGGQPEPMPVGPNVPIEARPSAPGAVVADPFEGAGAATGPYAPSTPNETAAQPTHLPPSRFPIMNVEDRADEIIRHFAQGGNTTPDERALITPAGLAQTTGNGGLAALWRLMATATPEGINAIQGFKDRVLAARQAFVTRLVGTQEDLDALRGQRLANTRQAYNSAFGEGQTTPVNPQAQIDQIDSILQSPQGVRSDIAQPLRQIRDMFYERDPVTGQLPTDAQGNPVRTLITDPERLYNIRRDINDSMRGPAANSTLPNARAAAHVMGDVLNGLDETIASGAPNYPDYMQQYADQSRQINAMEFLQGRNLTDAAGNTTLAKVDSAVKAAEQQRGIDPRRRPADALTDDQMNDLYTLRDDLRRQANETKGKALGSDTVQNFATSSIANNLLAPAARAGARAVALKVAESTGIPFLEYPAMLAENWIENRLTGGEGRAAAVRQAVIRRLLNEDNSGTRALSGVPSPGQAGAP